VKEFNNMAESVAKIDIEHYEILRNNVNQFILFCASKYDADQINLLDIAPQVHEGANLHFKKARISTLDIDSSSGATYIADLCKNNSNLIKNGMFDYVVCTEVLEHTLNPFRAVTEICRMLKSGGKVFISVPFNFRIHGPLPDCWRISEYGLKSLFSQEYGFKVISIQSIETKDRYLMPIHYTLIAEKL
jgi:hypothetical protein